MKNNRSDIKKAILFIEELSWLLESRKNVDLRKVISNLEELQTQRNSIDNFAKHYQSPNPNKHFLIGVLPKLFQDSKLFPTNESISSFAEEILKIQVPRFEKRSKYELIGLIVCKTEKLNDKELSNLVDALLKITNTEERLNRLREQRKHAGFSWNETIQKLTEHK